MGRIRAADLIVDSSAVVAAILSEPHWETLLAAISTSRCIIPAPVLTELQLTTPRHGAAVVLAMRSIVSQVLDKGGQIAAFEQRHAEITAFARDLYGRGNGRGGKLNFGDLMVYAIAKDIGQPLLCTGSDFSTTDLIIHPASRTDS